MKTPTFSVIGWLAAAALLSACSSVPQAAPDQVAADILVDLEAGRRASADESFAKLKGNAEAVEVVYPVLYEAASAKYDGGEMGGSVEILRFMAAHYPNAVAVREGLVYSLFLERAESTQADPALLDEIDQNLEDLRRLSADDGPIWIDLVATQQAIDRDRIDDARTSFDRFLASWDGTPPSLVPYVEDLNRYLLSH